MPESQSKKQTEFETVRLNFLDPPEYRSTSAAKDRRFVNGYFEPSYNKIKQAIAYHFVKRPGIARSIQPPAGAATARGCYAWKENIFSVFGRKIYRGTSDLGITMPTADATSMCNFAETRPGASTEYLGVNTGQALYLIATDYSVIVLNNVFALLKTLGVISVVPSSVQVVISCVHLGGS